MTDVERGGEGERTVADDDTGTASSCELVAGGAGLEREGVAEDVDGGTATSEVEREGTREITVVEGSCWSVVVMITGAVVEVVTTGTVVLEETSAMEVSMYDNTSLLLGEGEGEGEGAREGKREGEGARDEEREVDGEDEREGESSCDDV